MAQTKGLILQVGHIERFNPAVAEMVKHVNKPAFIEVSRLGPYDPRLSHVGVVLDLMIHDLDIILSMVKEPVVRLDAIGGKVISEHTANGTPLVEKSNQLAVENEQVPIVLADCGMDDR